MGQVGRAADGDVGGAIDGAERDLRGLARGDLRLVGDGLRDQRVQRGVDFRQGVAENQLRQFRALRRGGEPLVPLRMDFGAAPRDVAPFGQDRLRHDEGRVGPAELFAGAGDFFRSQRLAMRLGGSGAGRGAEADGGAAGDQPGLVALRPRLGDGGGDLVGIMAVDPRHVPAGRREAGDLVGRGRKIGRAVDGNMIVVPQHDQLAELEMAGHVDGFVRNAFHQAAVASDHIGIMIDQIVPKARVGQALGQRHAHGGGDALAERAGRRLDAQGMAIFRMAGGPGAELAEILQLLDRHVGIADEIMQRILQHRAMAGGQHEAVAVGPGRIGRIDIDKFREQHGGDIGHAHGHAGMAGLGFLHRVHRQGADGVGQILEGGLGPAAFGQH